MARPFLEPILEYLQHGWSDVVLGVQPRQGGTRMERGSPFETSIRLEFHTEERVWQASEVVVIYPGVYKCGREAYLHASQQKKNKPPGAERGHSPVECNFRQ